MPVNAMEVLEFTEIINNLEAKIKHLEMTNLNLKESLAKRSVEVAKLYNEISLLTNQANNTKTIIKPEYKKHGNKPQ